MNILASFPLYSHPDIARMAIGSLMVSNVNLYIVCNNVEHRKMLENINHIFNEINNYCNGAWNQAMEYFLKNNYDWLVLSSQDVILRYGWFNEIPANPMEVYVPSYSPTTDGLTNHDARSKELTGGIAGACTFLPKQAVELIYPIPEGIKLWYGDEYIYTKLRKHGWKIMQAPIAAFHYGSLSIADNKHAHQVIKADKLAWEKVKLTI